MFKVLLFVYYNTYRVRDRLLMMMMMPETYLAGGCSEYVPSGGGGGGVPQGQGNMPPMIWPVTIFLSAEMLFMHEYTRTMVIMTQL